MSGFYKNIAVIKGIKSGFSVDGGTLSGIVRTEQYGKSLKVEVTLINFAPLSEGRYVYAIGDGTHFEVFEGGLDAQSEVDTKLGFAAAVYFVHATEISPIAVAVCGGYTFCLPLLKAEVERIEGVKAASYEDEAIAEENYYEYDKTNADGGSIRTAKEEADGENLPEDAANPRPQTSFFESVREEVKRLLDTYPIEENLTRLIEHSRFVKITYEGERYYVFGVIYGDERVDYLCYGVPSSSDTPPESMKHLASFVPLSLSNKKEGYWLSYQDAVSGKELRRI